MSLFTASETQNLLLPVRIFMVLEGGTYKPTDTPDAVYTTNAPPLAVVGDSVLTRRDGKRIIAERLFRYDDLQVDVVYMLAPAHR